MKQLAHDVLNEHEFNFYFAPEERGAYAVSTSVGSGKTRTAIKYKLAAERASKNFIYVAPTIRLVNQTTKDLKDSLARDDRSARNINLVHSETHYKEATATEAALNRINDCPPDIGATVILTTQTFLNILPRMTGKRNWRVILDEAFTPLSFIEYKLGNRDRESGKEYFESLFTVSEQDGGLVTPATGQSGLVSAVAACDWNEAGSMYKGMEGLSRCVLNAALRVELADKHKDRYLFATWVTPNHFEDFIEVIFMAALFEETILHKFWSAMYGVSFKSHRFFEEAIERNIHKSQGPLVSVGHVLHTGDNTSKYNLQRNYQTGKSGETEVGLRVVDKIIGTASTFAHGNPFLLQLNTWTGYHSQHKDKIPSNAELIPTVSHGLNDYKGTRYIATFASTNPEPYQVEWIKKRTGLNDDEIYRAFRIHTVYQACGRTAIRDWENDKPVVFLTVGEDDARFLHQLFEGSTWLGQVGGLPKYRKPAPRLSDNPEYQRLTKIRRRLTTKKSRGKAMEADLAELADIKVQIASL